MKHWSLLLVVGLAVLLSGCLTGRDEHTIPTLRDYKSLEKTRAMDAARRVDDARRVGAGHFAPYAYESAANYLAWSEMERAESDKKGEWDYAALAIRYANEAIATGSGIPDGGPMPMPENWDAAVAEFERLSARYRELDPCKAKLVAPVPYAHIEANLSLAEHELAERWCHYVEGSRYLALVEADIDAIWAKDADADGVRDMDDGEPWIPEDKDGYEDDDGIPEPKPYPILTPVYFAKDSVKLTAEHTGYLRGIAKMLVDGYSEATVNIVGHTDSDASDTYNQGLSQRRVEAVKACLVANGADAAKIVSDFKGESMPAVDNTSAANMAKNRRVTIVLDSPDVKSPYCN